MLVKYSQKSFKKNKHLCGFVFAAIINHNDLIGERRVLFLQAKKET